MRRALALVAALLPLAAQAEDPPAWGDAGVVACDQTTLAEFIAEPWEENTATYADGVIRVTLLDHVEPAAAAFRLMVLSPPHDELGLRQCRVVEVPGGHGYGNIDFAAREARYDPETGLTLTFPVRWGAPDEGDDGWFQLALRIDQRSGRIVTQGMK